MGLPGGISQRFLRHKAGGTVDRPGSELIGQSVQQDRITE